MSDKIPITPLITSPIGLEAAVQQLQVKTATLSFMQYVFGLADPVVTDNKIRPMVYQGLKADELCVFPNDALKSFAFFHLVDGNIDYNYGDPAQNQKYAKISCRLAVIFWFNLKRIENVDYRNTKSKLRDDIVNLFARELYGQSSFLLDKTVENDLIKIYEGFDIEDNEKYALPMHPYWALRVEGDFWFDESCYVAKSYNV